MDNSLDLLKRISLNPNICHGKPCIRDLRYPVETILELLSAGMSFEEVLADHEDLELSDLIAVLEFTNHLNVPERRDKSSLLELSVWTEEDIQQIEEGQRRLNEWRIPELKI